LPFKTILSACVEGGYGSDLALANRVHDCEQTPALRHANGSKAILTDLGDLIFDFDRSGIEYDELELRGRYVVRRQVRDVCIIPVEFDHSSIVYTM
jgi:hypothetical protein